jgi:hypothetical protein
VVVETLSCVTRRTEVEDACDQNAKWKNREDMYGSRKLNQGIEMGESCNVVRMESTNIRNAYAHFVRKTIGEIPLGRPRSS